MHNEQFIEGHLFLVSVLRVKGAPQKVVVEHLKKPGEHPLLLLHNLSKKIYIYIFLHWNYRANQS